MVAGERVSAYSKRPSHSSIPRLRLERVSDWSSHRYREAKKKMELMRGNRKTRGPRRGQGHGEAQARTMKMGVGRAMSARVVSEWRQNSSLDVATKKKVKFYNQFDSRSICVQIHTLQNYFWLRWNFNYFQTWLWLSSPQPFPNWESKANVV